MSLLDAAPPARHSDMVALLKSEHCIGHGHANALVAHYRAEKGL